MKKENDKILGRPKETLDSLPDEWQKDILEIYKIGGSDVEVKAKLYEFRGSFSNDLWDRWMKEEPIFSETIKTGKILAESWWMRNGRTNLKEAGFEQWSHAAGRARRDRGRIQP